MLTFSAQFTLFYSIFLNYYFKGVKYLHEIIFIAQLFYSMSLVRNILKCVLKIFKINYTSIRIRKTFTYPFTYTQKIIRRDLVFYRRCSRAFFIIPSARRQANRELFFPLGNVHIKNESNGLLLARGHISVPVKVANINLFALVTNKKINIFKNRFSREMYTDRRRRVWNIPLHQISYIQFRSFLAKYTVIQSSGSR